MGQSQDSFFGGGLGGSKGVEYYCMSCGTKHNKAACPNCGSRMKRVGF
jgi:rubrerythrin